MPSPNSTLQFCLPDLLAHCTLKASTNPYYKEAGAESRAWINSYDIFTDRKRAFLIQGQSELLCSYTYPYAGHEQFRTTCDFVNLLFVIDEISDDQNGKDAAATGRVFVNAMTSPHWDDGSVLAKITNEFRVRFLRLAGPRSVKRFGYLCERYAECVAREAELRERGDILDSSLFLPHRRNNSAVLLCLCLAEYILGIDLGDDVYENELFMDAYWAVCDHVCWANDIYSYDLERSRGLEGNNIVTVIMKEKGISLQDSVDYVGKHCDHLADQYLSARKQLSSSLVGPDAVRFIDALGNWMIGNLVWSFKTVRYFGARLEEVKNTRIVVLRPREVADGSCSESESDEE